MYENLKKMMKEMEEYFSRVEKLAPNLVTWSGDCYKILKKDLMAYCMYLSCSDDTIRDSEADFIRQVLGAKVNSDIILQNVEKLQIYSTKFETTVPNIMKLMVKFDNYMYRESKLNMLASSLIIKVFETVGREIVACDNDIALEEVRDSMIYLKTLQEYQTKKIHKRALDMVKYSDSVASVPDVRSYIWALR